MREGTDRAPLFWLGSIMGFVQNRWEMLWGWDRYGICKCAKNSLTTAFFCLYTFSFVENVPSYSWTLAMPLGVIGGDPPSICKALMVILHHTHVYMKWRKCFYTKTGLQWEKSPEETDSIDEAFLAARTNPSALADSYRLQARILHCIK